jgi:hypothetical protein
MKYVAILFVTVAWYFAYVALSFAIQEHHAAGAHADLMRLVALPALAFATYALVVWQLLRRRAS